MPHSRSQPARTARAADRAAEDVTVWWRWMSAIAPQSETTKPSNPHSVLSTSRSSVGLAQQGSPLVRLYAPITEYAPPSTTQSWNAGR